LLATALKPPGPRIILFGHGHGDPFIVVLAVIEGGARIALPTKRLGCYGRFIVAAEAQKIWLLAVATSVSFLGVPWMVIDRGRSLIAVCFLTVIFWGNHFSRKLKGA
jgi:hypothetical protein